MFMNVFESDILLSLRDKPFINQRMLAEACDLSLGIVNRSMHTLMQDGYLDDQARLTEEACLELKEKAPKNAVILAAGFGMRMVPINMSTPKAFLDVNGERLIERLIRQLHEVGITDITVVVGFMKESFEYLIDAFGVDLVVNEGYASTNNLYSLAKALDRIGNTYIIPCDIWCERNPFRRNELYSWYMVSDSIDDESDVRVNRKRELVKSMGSGNTMVGIAYLLKAEAERLKTQILAMTAEERYGSCFWEEALYCKNRMIVHARVVHNSDVFEINTYEQLRELDSHSNHLKSDAIETIADVFQVSPADVQDITVLKKGMTNRSFLFSVKGRKYIMRIPGEGTDQLINRRQEAEVYRVISGHGLCDDPIYINPDNGYKITAFLDDVRVCDAEDVHDLRQCMEKLKAFHNMKLQVSHTFDIFGQIEFYEKLWEGEKSVYRDYEKTKANVFSLKSYIESQDRQWSLTHIDAVPDNFLFYQANGGEALQLTDWEYSGMQDPHVDIAMFCIYSLYNRRQVDQLIDIYFDGECSASVRTKIYCYIAACGLLWSNWCEYKRKLGVEFGEYSLRQYRFAKDYYRYAKELMTEVEKA